MAVDFFGATNFPMYINFIEVFNMRRKAAVTFVTRYKSNQKNSWGYKHFATADGFNFVRLIGTQTCIPITVTAIKAQQTYKFYLPPTDTHSDVWVKFISVSLLRSGSQHLISFISF